MTKADVKKFAEIMAFLGTIFSKELTSTAMKMYFKTLIDLPIEEIETAAMRIANVRTITGTFPLPAEFRQAVDNKNGSIEERAELAWNALIWAIEHVGHWQSVMFDDPVIHDVVQALGGWLKIQNADNPEWNHEKQLQWRRKDFLAMYRLLAKSGRPSIPYLIGEQQAANAGVFDRFVPQVVRITGQPGQYLAIPHERPKELPRPEDFELLKKLSEVSQLGVSEGTGV